MTKPYPPEAQTEIDAPLHVVWQTLLNAEVYSDWNSFIPQALGDPLILKAPINMRVQLGTREVGAVMASVIVEPPADGKARWVHEHASWLARTGLVRSQRHHELTALSDGQMRYRTWELFSCLLKAFVPYGLIDAGFKQQAADLKTVCEGCFAKER